MSKETAADNEIVRRVQFEEERLTRTQAAKLGLSAGLPEIDFVNPRLLGQEGEPVIVCDADETLHIGPRLSGI